jgi:hypothetical protein
MPVRLTGRCPGCPLGVHPPGTWEELMAAPPAWPRSGSRRQAEGWATSVAPAPQQREPI